MDSNEETFRNLADLTFPTSIFERIPEFTLDDLYPHPFNDSFAHPIPEMIPQQTEITLDDLFPPTIIAPSIEPIPVMIRQQMEISSSLPEEVDNFNSGVVPRAVDRVEGKQLEEENKVHEKESRRKYEVWTEKEHRLFLEGVEKYKGQRSKIWKKVATEFVVSKTPRQVASHAQKFFKRQKIEEGKRLRWSINDIARPL